MQFNRKIMVIYCIIMELIFLIGCSNHEQNRVFLYDMIPKIEISEKVTMQDDGNNVEKMNEEMRLIGVKLKELSSVSGINEPAILVNGEAITKKSIESSKIQRSFALDKVKNNAETLLKSDIILMVRQKITEMEATRKGIEPSQDRINKHLKQQKEINKTSGTISSYAKGMGITEEECYNVIKESAYGMYQRVALLESVVASQKDKIKAESIKRSVGQDVVEREYIETYIDGLIKKAKIEILDPEIKKLFDIEN